MVCESIGRWKWRKRACNRLETVAISHSRAVFLPTRETEGHRDTRKTVRMLMLGLDDFPKHY